MRWHAVSCDFCEAFDAMPKPGTICKRIRRCSFCEKHVCDDCGTFRREDDHDYVRACPDCEPLAEAVELEVRGSLGRYERFDEAMKRAVAKARRANEAGARTTEGTVDGVES